MLDYTVLKGTTYWDESDITSENCSLKCSDGRSKLGIKAGEYQESKACGDCEWTDPLSQQTELCQPDFLLYRIFNSAPFFAVIYIFTLPITQLVLSGIGRCCCQNQG